MAIENKELKKLYEDVSQGRTLIVISEILNLVINKNLVKPDRIRQEVIMLKSRYENVVQKRKLGIIKIDDEQVEINRINYSLILLLDDLNSMQKKGIELDRKGASVVQGRVNKRSIAHNTEDSKQSKVKPQRKVSKARLEALMRDPRFKDMIRSPRKDLKGNNLRITIFLSKDEVRHGSIHKVRYKRYKKCMSCDGRGSENKSDEKKCYKCSGNGYERYVKKTFLGGTSSSKLCELCGGKGYLIVLNCEFCEGKGRVFMYDTIEIKIPPRLAKGEELVIKGKGNCGKYIGFEGDLLVIIDHK